MNESPTLGSFLKRLDSEGELREIPRELSPAFEAAAAEQFFDSGRALVIRARGHDFPIVANILNTKRKYEIALGVPPGGAEDAFSNAIAKASKPREATGGFLKNDVKVDLERLPVVSHFERDAGPYVTSSLVMARDGRTGAQNMSVHRLLRVSKDSFVIRMVEGRHLHRAFAVAGEAGGDLPVAVAIGVHPAVEIAASYQAPYGVDELDIANGMLGGALTTTEVEGGLRVPSCAEIVLVGRILRDRSMDDCMVEMLGNYDMSRKQPVVKVERMYHRDGAVYRDILPGGREHRLLMSYAVEVKLNRAVRDVVPTTRRVVLTDGGRNWLHAVIQMKKRLQGEPKNAILAAFAAHPSLKHVVVVDEDIDPADPVAVEYAVASRFQASEGLVVVKGAKGSSLDPSSDQKLLLTDKMGLDATASLTKDPGRFEMGRIPGYDKMKEEMGRI
ncbi:MAG: UbiD family decarboxylase [Nitrososphaerota archaeon]|nr:UbiD family decarboxylase [Nitrososphaerota archaeon]MDG6939103.1 UbiD family decarboxylase [Nitrososphaerota archaeon]